jgi:hypothetical protein
MINYNKVKEGFKPGPGSACRTVPASPTRLVTPTRRTNDIVQQYSNRNNQFQLPAQTTRREFQPSPLKKKNAAAPKDFVRQNILNNGKRFADRNNGLLQKLENDRTRRSQLRSKNQTPENTSAATASTNRKQCTTPVK